MKGLRVKTWSPFLLPIYPKRDIPTPKTNTYNSSVVEIPSGMQQDLIILPSHIQLMGEITMPEKITLGQISVIIDDDTGMYHIGEIDGGFVNDITLRHHIEKYGKDELINTLSYMIARVVNEHRALQDRCQQKQCSTKSDG